MSRTRMRLEKLEAISAPPARVVVVHGRSDGEHTAQIDALKRAARQPTATCSSASCGFLSRPHSKGRQREAV